MARNLFSCMLRRLRAVGRRVTPPGNRIPLDESGDQHPIDADYTPSEAGQRQKMEEWRM